jgi:hypothetical protein
MADKKITALTESTSLSTDDLFHVVDSPGSSPSNKKITVNNVFNKIPSVLGLNSTETLTGATTTAVSLTTNLSLLNGTSGLVNSALGSGTLTGQIKMFVATAHATPPQISVATTLGAWARLTFLLTGSSAICMWTGSAWALMSTSTSAAGTGIATPVGVTTGSS